MKKLALVIVAGALFLPGSASAQLEQNSAGEEPAPTVPKPTIPTPPIVEDPIVPIDPCLERTQGQHKARARAVIKRAFPLKKWQAGAKLPRRNAVHSKPDRFRKKQRRILEEKLGCLEAKSDRKDVRQLKQRRNANYREAADWYDSWCAPPGWLDPNGAGCWVKSSALVACEAGTSQPGRHSPAWRAANPSSSASGPYQGLLGTWPIAWPVITWADAMTHHQVFGPTGSGHNTYWACGG